MYLYLSDLYTKADSPAISLDSLAPENSDATVLNGIRELSARRNQSVGRECCTFEPENIELHVKMFEKYLSLLQQFIVAASSKGWSLELGNNTAASTTVSTTFGFRWASPLTGRSSYAHTPLTNILVEFAMSLCFYAAALQEHAWRLLQNSIISPEHGGGGGDHHSKSTLSELSEEDSARLTTAASLLRKSAGVYAHIRNNLLPEIEKKDALLSSSKTAVAPLEPRDATALEVLETAALAQAQGIAAERAERKGASPTAVAAVHRGAVDLYEAAAAKVKTSISSLPPPSERFRMWLALSAELHAIKALRAQAEICRQDGELGQASACLKDSILRIQRCLTVVSTAKEEAAWRSPFLSELHVVESLHTLYEKERTVVYVQTVASTVPPPPQGKVIVAAAASIEFLAASAEAEGALKTVTEHYFI